MKKIAIIFLMFLQIVSISIFAKQDMNLTQIRFPISVEGWIKTASPLIRVNVTASVNPNQVAGFNALAINKLNSIAKTDWRITQFNRNQDPSGLERIQLVAEARVSDKSLNQLTIKAKAASESGQQYEISDIEYKPTLAETEQAHANLRQQIYQMAQEEAKRINQAFPEAHYEIVNINFLPMNLSASSMTIQPRALMTMSAGNSNSESSNSLAVDQKVTQNAILIFAAKNKLEQ